ncbi:MAG: hypothetical protein QOE46_343 [Acidobacteriota bacterium]|jgi:hypothetical protein|nr:hypothetical protein [Acidobacteriota bacterium]
MEIPILIHPEFEHYYRVDETIQNIRRTQNYFRPYLVEADWLPNDDERVVSPDKVWELFYEHFPEEPAIIIISNPLTENYFSYAYRYLNIITTRDWESKFAPPPLKVYLTYLMAEALLYFAVDLPEAKVEQWTHDPPIGCFFDNIVSLKTLRLGMTGANLCGECEVKLFGMGLTDPALRGIEALLIYVREATIRRPRAAASHVFIGHGHSEIWKQLQRYLSKELGLLTEEFNQVSVAGRTTADRLQEMLGRACFAFLVMTAEDEHADEELHARENVVHEIGLFQGKLGFDKAIILKQKGCAEFSNIHGLTYIEFSKENLNGASKRQIRAALQEAGLVD